MAKVFVTGAAGFIGSDTCDRLLAAGHEVLGADNFRTGREVNLSAARMHSRFSFAPCDLTEAGRLDGLVENFQPDAIIHLAALVSVQESVDNPDLNFRLNVGLTQSVAETARKNGVKRIVFASSAAVYGDVRETPVRENADKYSIERFK